MASVFSRLMRGERPVTGETITGETMTIAADLTEVSTAFEEAFAAMASRPEPEPTFGPEAPAPMAVAVATEMEPALLTEYAALADAVGYQPTHLVIERFTHLLATLGLRVYDRAAVKAYLDHQWGCAPRVVERQPPRPVAELRVPWCWRPLRAADRAADRRERRTFDGLADTDRVAFWLEPYDKPVPMPVLLTVKRVLEHTPAARFYVSDLVKGDEMRRLVHEQPKNQDPFLLVVVAGEAFIIERWDEPSFRG